MINFPDTPTLAQIFTTAGSSWQWDGNKWEGATVAGGGPYLLLTGGTLTGTLRVNPNIVIGTAVTSPPATSLVINKAASTPQPFAGAQLWVANDAASAIVLADGYNQAPQLITRRSRGTAAAPAAVQATDGIGSMLGYGYGTTGYGLSARVDFRATETWTDAAQGAEIRLLTTTPGTIAIAPRVTVNRGVVIGNAAPDPGQGGLVLNANAAVPPVAGGSLLQITGPDSSPLRIAMDSIGGATFFNVRRSEGTAAAPTGLVVGSQIFGINASGHNGSAYGPTAAFVQMWPSQVWSSTAQGTYIAFGTTLNNTTTLTEAMRIDHNGNVGIGTAPSYKLHVSFPAATGTLVQKVQFTDSVSVSMGLFASTAAANWTSNVGLGLAVSNSTTASLAIDTTGNVGVNTTAPTEKLSVYGQAAVGLNVSAVRSGPNGADATTSLINFQSFDKSVTIGGIVRSGTNQVSYITTSDERLKDGIKASERGLDALMAIKVSDYKMGKTASQGLLAQDVAKVYPEAVHEGGKDPNLEPWMLDYGRLTPLIIKAVQDLAAKVAAMSPPPARKKAA